jgi:hypothetical protein
MFLIQASQEHKTCVFEGTCGTICRLAGQAFPACGFTPGIPRAPDERIVLVTHRSECQSGESGLTDWLESLRLPRVDTVAKTLLNAPAGGITADPQWRQFGVTDQAMLQILTSSPYVLFI